MTNERIINICGARCLVVEPTENAKDVVIVNFHGWGSEINRQSFFSQVFAKYGYTVVSPEVSKHEEGNRLEDYHAPGELEKYLWDIVVNTVKGAKVFLQHMQREDFAKGKKVVVYGNSMGGFIASGAFVQNEWIDGLINMNSSGDWHAVYEADVRQTIADMKIPADFHEMNPLNCVDKTNNRPVLLLHGEDDDIVLKSCQLNFLEKLNEIGNENVIYNEYWHVNHTVSLDMIGDIIHWLDEEFAE